jgi:predicted ATPase/DNA-binding SARP family transcriptional activator/DNA-binding CsgD family transcriptional regulator
VVARAGGLDAEDLYVQLLGGFRVSIGTRAIEESEWRLRKASTLIKLLALAPGHRLHREQILEVLWPDLEPDASLNNLHAVLHFTRRVLVPPPSAGSRVLQLQGGTLSLSPAGALKVDVELFEAAANWARRGRRPTDYRAALELYAGELLPNDRYEDWATHRREELHHLYLSLLIDLAAVYEGQGEFAAATEPLRQAVRIEPAHEEAQRALMRVYAQAGQRQQALRQYRYLRRVLRRELDDEPDAATERLHEEITSGRFPADKSSPAVSPHETTTAAPPHNLPAALTSFVGREAQIGEVSRLSAGARLLTLTGTGGCGKTRLAVEVARHLVDQYPDGVWLLELAALSDGSLVESELARLLGVRVPPNRPLAEVLAEALSTKQMLLILDNCEHLLDACAALIETLLVASPGLHVLATSRVALGVKGELHWRVPAFSLPPAGWLPPIEDVAQYESVRLFTERARYRQPEFELTSHNVQAVVEICRRLGGIPLAIELATARIPVLAPHQIAARLDDALGLLTGGGRVTAPRHRTLRGALDWSFHLLSDRERVLLARLSVFAGGWTLEAAEAVGAGGAVRPTDVLDVLSDLVSSSLVVVETGPGEVARYAFLEPVRQYARERLKESGEEEAARQEHARFFLALAEQAEPELKGTLQVEWLERLEREHDNLRAALAWALERDPALGLRLAGLLSGFWHMHSHHSEGLSWLERGLANSSALPASVRAKAFSGAGVLARLQADYKRAAELHEESLALRRELGDKAGIAASLHNLGAVALYEADYERSGTLYEQSLAMYRDLGDKRGVAYSLGSLGVAALERGDHSSAAALLEESVSVLRELGDKVGLARSIENLAAVVIARGDYDQARSLYAESLQLFSEAGDKVSVAACLEGLALVAGRQGALTRAALLSASAASLRAASNAPLPPSNLADYAGTVSAARAELGEEAFAKAWARGEEMTLEQVVEYAIAGLETPLHPERTPERGAPKDAGRAKLLSRREREVAELAARGLTNRQIAGELVISERTADAHLVSILKKLELSSRGQLASWLAKQHPHDPE